MNKNRKKQRRILTHTLPSIVLIILFMTATKNNIYTLKEKELKDIDVNISSISFKGNKDVKNPVISYKNKIASIYTTLNSKNRKILYSITLKNNADEDATIDNIELSDGTNITYFVHNASNGDVIKAHANYTFYIAATLNDNVVVENVSEPLVLNLLVTKNGNMKIKESKRSLFIGLQENLIVTSGDGLYVDNTESEKYIFKGENPNNYIIFNDELWRIISIENDGTMKIVKTFNSKTMAWDVEKNRDETVDTYCKDAFQFGCNAWSENKRVLDKTGKEHLQNFKLYYPNGNVNDDTSYDGNVTVDSSINKYLNYEYYENELNMDKQYIVEHKFNVGTPGNYQDVEKLVDNVNQEKMYVWVGKVGLITATEYMKATSENTCTSLNVANNDGEKCGLNNWLKPNSWYWTISPYVTSYRYFLWGVHSNGNLYSNYAYDNSGEVWPVVYLGSDTPLKGEGTIDNPYAIDN